MGLKYPSLLYLYGQNKNTCSKIEQWLSSLWLLTQRNIRQQLKMIISMKYRIWKNVCSITANEKKHTKWYVHQDYSGVKICLHLVEDWKGKYVNWE